MTTLTDSCYVAYTERLLHTSHVLPAAKENKTNLKMGHYDFFVTYKSTSYIPTYIPKKISKTSIVLLQAFPESANRFNGAS